MQNLLDNLKNLLRKDERLVSQGELLKNKVIELAIKLDKDLIELLLSNEQMKKVFFVDVGKATIFDKDKFIKFVSNKEFLPDSYTAFKNKIGLIDEKGEFISEKKDVVLSWPYKDCVLEGGMTKEDQKRDEVFWNETLAPDEISRLLDPKVFTNAKRIDKKGEHKFDGFRVDEKGDIKDNLIIKGNNLLVLHSLKKRFAGKVKLIYIDPPYNREDENFYNDSFRHSTWLTFMKNRLEIAKKLLKPDGVIFVQCDDREHAYLKVLMDEIFERENFISSIAIRVKAPSGVATGGLIFDVKENILVYGRKKDIEPVNNLIEKEIIDEKSKTIESYNLLFESEGEETEKVAELETQNGKIEIIRMKNYSIRKINFYQIKDVGKFYVENFEKIFRTATLSGGIEQKIKQLIPDSGLFSYYHTPTKGKYKGQKIKYYVYKKEGVLFLKENAIIKDLGRGKMVVKLEQLTNIISKDLWQGIANEGGVTLKYGKKPEELLRIVLELVTQDGDLVLDFFAGTGTTCAVAHKMGRQYIGVEQLDYGENSAVVRLKNVINGDQTGISKAVGWKGGGDFVYLELLKWNENFANEIKKAKTKEELKRLWERMKEKAFLSYKVDIKAIDENAKDFEDLSIEDKKRFLYECLDKNHLYVNYSEIDDAEYGVGEEDKKLNRQFYEY
ncbi:MAG: site-specific DNA-methyltransferase [candidate division WOR-3 bacterium]